MALNNALLKAVNRYGPSVDNLARSRYGVSGAALLAKLVQGESGGQPNRTSPAGAQGYTQFMPGSRRIAIDRYGVDPLAGADQAVHAAALHLLGKINGSKGLEGYNPGDPSYPNYILGQRVGNVHRGGMGGSSAPSSPQSVTTTVTPGATSGGGFDPGQGGDQTALLAALLSQPKTPSPVSVPTPAFAQNRYLKVGASPTINAPQQQAPDMGSLLDALQAQGTDLPAGPSSAAPSVNVHVTGAQKGSNAPQGHRSRLLELFYNGPGGINAKNGQVEPRGFVSGHTDHVHVAAGPKTVADLGRLAEQMGLHVGENPQFGGVHPVHVANSYHYKGQAVDVSGPPALMRKFDRRVAQLYGLT